MVHILANIVLPRGGHCAHNWKIFQKEVVIDKGNKNVTLHCPQCHRLSTITAKIGAGGEIGEPWPPQEKKTSVWEKACREWLKGCSCAGASNQEECVECTKAFHDHLRRLNEVDKGRLGSAPQIITPTP